MTTDFTTCRGPDCSAPGSADRPFCPSCHAGIPANVRHRLASALRWWRQQKKKDYSRVAASIREAVREISPRVA